MENTSVLIDQDDDEIEIDILQILRVLKKKLWLILLIGILSKPGKYSASMANNINSAHRKVYY